MLRDTFAVEYLLAGMPLEEVSRLLGHASVLVTQKHYAPWFCSGNNVWLRVNVPHGSRWVSLRNPVPGNPQLEGNRFDGKLRLLLDTTGVVWRTRAIRTNRKSFL